MKRKFAYLLLTIFVVACTACIPMNLGRGGGSSVSQPQGLAAAEQAYDQGRYQEASRAYEQYLQQNPSPDRLESILAAYAISSERAGLYPKAVLGYERLVREFPQGRFAAEARLRLPALYLLSDEPAKAESLAQALLSGESDPARQSRLSLSLGQAKWARGAYAESAREFMSAWNQGDAKTKAEAKAGLEAALPRLSDADLAAWQRQYGQNFPGPEAAYVLAWNAAQRHDAAAVESQAQYFEQYLSAHELAPAMAAAAAAARQGAAPPAIVLGGGYSPKPAAPAPPQTARPQVGTLSGGAPGQVNLAVILPVTGDEGGAKYSQEIINGLKLAVASYQGQGGLGLKVMDTKGSAEAAAALVREAAGQPDVLAVVGPFLSREAAPAAQAAQAASLPMVAVTQRIGLTDAGSFIFRVCLTPKHQAEAVARYSVKGGNQSLAILYPDDGYGRPMRQYFEAAVSALGGRLVAAESYDPKSKNWGEAVTRLVGGQGGTPGFTALYLPDSGLAVSQIMPLLAYQNIAKMQYLGSPLWQSRDLLTNAGRYLEGSVIPVALSEYSRRPETQKFIADYRAAYGHAPDQFAAYGHDAGLALVSALAQGAGGRDEIRRVLAQGRKLPGAAGPFSFAPNGEYQIDPTLLTIEGSQFKLLRDAE